VDDARPVRQDDPAGWMHAYTTQEGGSVAGKKQDSALSQSQEASRERLVDLVDFAPIGFLTLNHAGVIMEANHTVAKLLGVEREKMLASPFIDFVTPQDCDRWHRHFTDASKQDGLRGCQMELRRGDGSTVHVQMDCRSIMHDGMISMCATIADISERRERDALIQKLSAAVEQSSASIIITDVSGSIEYVNPAFSRVSGYSSEEAIGRNPHILKSEETPADVFSDMWQSILAGRIWEHELCNKRKDGSLYWETVSIAPVKNELGDITHFVGVQNDISKRRMAEESLKKYSEQYRALFENMFDIYYKSDLEGHIQIVSPSCLKQTGYTQEELIGRRVTEFYANPEERRGLLNQLMQKGQVNDFDVVLIHRDGTPRIASVTAHLLTDEGGKPIGVEGILRDIGERKRAEEALRVSEEKFRSIAQSSYDAILITDLAGRFTYVSPADERNTGYRPEEVLGKCFLEFLPATTIPEASALFARALQGESLEGVELKAQTKDGIPFYIESNVTPIYKGDEMTGFLIIYRNITERREAEAAQELLLLQNRELMRQLMQVQEEERRLLARDLHDELGQLLTSINARAEYIARHAEGEELRGMAKEIVRDTKASFEASHATLMRLRPATLDALGLSAALSELTAQSKKLFGMQSSLQIEGELDYLDDRHAIAIYRLVQEGVTNAYRHGRASRVDVILKKIPPHAGRDGHVQIEIIDDGKGLHVQGVSNGMGVIGMRERVQALGGTFLLTDIPQDGVRIEAILPLGDGEEN